MGYHDGQHDLHANEMTLIREHLQRKKRVATRFFFYVYAKINKKASLLIEIRFYQKEA